MGDNHILHELDQSPGSFVLLAPSEEPEIAVVFVHGFWGDPYDTWIEFHRLIDECQQIWWSRCDVYFYSYPSVSRQIKISALQLSEFLRNIYPNPVAKLFTINTEDIGTPGGGQLSADDSLPKYQKLVLVGHSEGGAVIRYMTLRALEIFEDHAAFRATATADPASSTQLFGSEDAALSALLLEASVRLFAPAIGGYRPSGIKGVIASMPLLGQLCTSLLNYSAGFQDMNPQELQALREQIEIGAQKHSMLKALRASILWGADETVLKTAWFECDKVRVVPGKNHLSICKPDSDYTDPIDFVCE